MQSFKEKNDGIRSYYCTLTGQSSKLYFPPLTFFLDFDLSGIFI
jgi:hypothetical protein